MYVFSLMTTMVYEFYAICALCIQKQDGEQDDVVSEGRETAVQTPQAGRTVDDALIDDAAVKIQTAGRGFLARRRLRRIRLTIIV